MELYPYWHFITLLQFVLTRPALVASEKPACSSEIFCRGDLLRTVQMARIFNDSKSFVDMRLKKDAAEVLLAFQALPSNVSKMQVAKFVSDNFHPEGHDLEVWIPTDWKENPELIGKVKDQNLKNFASKLNGLWKKLGRNISDEARRNPDRSSLIIVPNPFIVPGGRFREYYYWDSYWVINGLLICEMKDTARGMIDNFVKLVDTYGFVPNGGRRYYTNRSQPPFLIPMVDLYLNQTGDIEYVKSILGTLENEYSFWRQNHTVEIETSSGQKYNLSIYSANMDTPRPESYYEDVHTAQGVPDDEKPTLYQDIASAAESGWDFSTRWFNRKEKDLGSLNGTKTRQIVPTDLNSVLYYCERLLMKFSLLAGDTQKANTYKRYSEARRDAIQAVLWDNDIGLWFDYDRQQRVKRKSFYASSVVPLWAGVHRGNVSWEKDVFGTLQRLKVLDYLGGLPTSLFMSGQQWDFPNAWPPLQHMFMAGFAKSSDKEIRDEALHFAQKWITTNYKAWKSTGHMFEKFNVSVQGAPGGGGEYSIQVGFGWTNGVVLDFLNRYPDKLHSGEELTIEATLLTKVHSKGCFSKGSLASLITGIFVIFSISF
ncbi:trehalase-like isoform X1 [Acropora muricata]|uniref:trehalase-like isoform X1 n=1 Tax=Acropora muricata TaxID=159855 RepID=UPI0034E4AA12